VVILYPDDLVLDYTIIPRLFFFGGIQRVQSNLQLLYDSLRKRNITLLVVIAPNKATIYPDTLPDQLQKINSQSELDLLTNSVQQHGPPVLVDLRPALWQARQQRQIYYKTDTHWNSYGVFVAYTQIMEALSHAYPALQPLPIGKFSLKATAPTVHDIAHIMGATNILEPGYVMIPKGQDVHWVTYNDDPIPMMASRSSNQNAPRLLMYFDSFGQSLIPLIAPQFSEATYILNITPHSDLVTLSEIDNIQPDIVIVEFVERYLPAMDVRLQNFGLDSR
jgi:alginate O-acetyltransferase complex protein AlgJ